MSAVSIVVIVLATLAGLGLIKFAIGWSSVWLSDRLGLCGLCHKEPAEYLFDDGKPGSFGACAACLDVKIGPLQRLRWTETGRLTPLAKPEPAGAK